MRFKEARLFRVRRSKIVCAIGPASADEEPSGRLVEDGMDVAPLNFSHETHDKHVLVIERIRRLGGGEGAILQDLSGPRVLIGTVRCGRVTLLAGATVMLVPPCRAIAPSANRDSAGALRMVWGVERCAASRFEGDSLPAIRREARQYIRGKAVIAAGCPFHERGQTTIASVTTV